MEARPTRGAFPSVLQLPLLPCAPVPPPSLPAAAVGRPARLASLTIVTPGRDVGERRPSPIRSSEPSSRMSSSAQAFQQRENIRPRKEQDDETASA